MIEGWHNDGYLILFEGEQDEAAFSRLYCIADYLPGYAIVGLWGWDDFILRDESGQYFTVPTVPLISKNIWPFLTKIDPSNIRPDAKLSGKIKWYIKPIVFGGDPQARDNMAWISIDQHAEIVKWWNQKYREIKGNKS